jgi:release factor glutamine methyltransferase
VSDPSSAAALADTAAARLVRAGLPPDEARRDAALLAQRCLRWDQAAWITRGREPAPEEFGERFAALVDRRARREPVSQILGEREFYGRVLRVTSDVLTPRPETEFVVDEALAVIDEGARSGRPVVDIVDVGTGTGCLAVTLAAERPGLRIVATDLSRAALAIAGDNARRLGVASAIQFKAADLCGGAVAAADLIVANPPYVPERDRALLPPEVAEHEPASALFGGADGLDVVRRLVPDAARALRPRGWLVMEIGYGQSEQVERLVSDVGGLRLDRIVPDLREIPRVVVARRAD